MAKSIIVSLAGASSSFALEKLDRSKLYGRRERRHLDPTGERCEKAELTRDGALLVRAGMTAQGYFDDDGTWIPSRELVGLDRGGAPLSPAPSTLGVSQELRGPLSPEEVLDVAVRAVYRLEPEQIDAALAESLRAGDAFGFTFNYRADFQAETAILVANEHGMFALVGQPTTPSWSSLTTTIAPTFVVDDEEAEGDLDFEMF